MTIPGRYIRSVKELEKAGFTIIPPDSRTTAYTLVPNGVSMTSKPPMLVTGMWGIGDCIHERAALRALMKTHEVWIDTPHLSIVHDLIEQGLRPYANRRASHSRIRERTEAQATYPPTQNLQTKHITYDPASIREHGTILGAIYASVGLSMPSKPDFSLPVPKEWHALLDKTVPRLAEADKPILIYRPIIVNHGWFAPARCPDTDAYNELCNAIREQFFTVSIARLSSGDEWIKGPIQPADLVLHHAELTFESMAALFQRASFVFANAGFTPVLAQAVGTPVIIVYGGNEAFDDTNIVGRHLAPTLAIEPINPCRCHKMMHDCDKTIDMPKAHDSIRQFLREAKPRQKTKVLIFGTMYADNEPRVELTELWVDLHRKLNPDCDLLLVDSQSPLREQLKIRWFTKHPRTGRLTYFSFDDNIGHLSRNGPQGPASQGRDGWGRAFCWGLQYAIDYGYDYVAHIEADSLLRLPVREITDEMRSKDINVLSVPVTGTKSREIGWVETGLMFFNTAFLEQSSFISRYNWQFEGYRRTPEAVIFKLLGDDLHLENWRASRADKDQITLDNVHKMDWITHCRRADKLDDMNMYHKFTELALKGGEINVEKDEPKPISNVSPPQPREPKGLDKINLGCGTNRLEGWRNFDTEVNITQPLPFPNNSASHILAEHVVEHEDYYSAIRFFKQCHRVLAAKGILRVAVPSLEQIWHNTSPEYIKFVHDQNKWAPTADARGAMHAILFAHGHKTAWTTSLLLATLYYCGFDFVSSQTVGHSADSALREVEGHGKVIGDKFNRIETIVVEAVKS